MSHGLRVEYEGFDRDLDLGVHRIMEEHGGVFLNSGFLLGAGIRDLEYDFLYDDERSLVKERLEDTFCEENIGIKITVTEFEYEEGD